MTKSNQKKTNSNSSTKSKQSLEVCLNNHVKKQALQSYVQSLVNSKLKSTLKKNRIPNHQYDQTYAKIQAIGMSWLTPSALKSCVICAFNAQLFNAYHLPVKPFKQIVTPPFLVNQQVQDQEGHKEKVFLTRKPRRRPTT